MKKVPINEKELEKICKKCPYRLGKVMYFVSSCPNCKKENGNPGMRLIEKFKK